MKPSGASARTEQAAATAADRTFGSRPALPLDQQQTDDAAQEGRHRLAGAFAIQIDRIRPDPSQPRRLMDATSLQELTDSISRWGILQPITVRYLSAEKTYQVITGERRFQAAQKAGLQEIPCRVMNPEENDILVHQVIENWQRVDLEPFEIADALAALKATQGYSQKQMAELMGKSEGEISKLLSLLDLSPAAQNLARQEKEGQLTRRHLYAAKRLSDDKQRPFLERIKTEKLTVEQAEEAVARVRPAPSAMPKRGAPVTRMKFVTREATVQMIFRRKVVSPDMVKAVLDEVRRQLDEPPKGDVTIIRAK